MEPTALAQQFADLARELLAAGDVDATLQRMIDLAVETIHGCDHAGISLAVDDHLETAVQSDDVPARIDRIQLDAGEGPHLDVPREEDTVVSDDLAREPRWTPFAAEVVERTGVRSLLALRLFIDETVMGSLNLYADAANAFDDEARGTATIFAAHAAVALRAAQQQQQLFAAFAGDDVDVIGTAKGLIMASDDVDAATALATLRTAATRLHLELREVADRIIERELEDEGPS